MLKRTALTIALCATVQLTQGATINFTSVRSGLDSWNGFAVDPSTGVFFLHQGFAGSNQFTRYANEAAFATNTGGVVGTLASATGPFGTYFAVRSGELYGRADSATNTAATWSLASGSMTTTTQYIGMGGVNASNGDVFDWGGYSGVNFMQDSTGLYVVGGQANSNNWQIEHLGSGIASMSTKVFTPLGDLFPGWGFIINGILFTGANYNSNLVTSAVDVDTGMASSASHELLGLGSSWYLSNFSYDYSTDTLYAFNSNTATLFKASNASVQFGVNDPVVSVPEPGTLLLAGLGLSGLALTRRRMVGGE